MQKNFVSKKDILREVRIIDIADEFGIELEATSSGNFDFKCVCPSAEHKNGSERTGSCFIDSRNNNFFCFGCNAGSNSIDFYMFCVGLDPSKDFGEAMKALRGRVKTGTGRKNRYVFERDNFLTLLNISSLFRRTMLNHPKDLKWVNALMRKSDKYISNIQPNDIEKAEKLYKVIQKKIIERYK
jgi:hypothetical protein